MDYSFPTLHRTAGTRIGRPPAAAVRTVLQAAG